MIYGLDSAVNFLKSVGTDIQSVEVQQPINDYEVVYVNEWHIRPWRFAIKGGDIEDRLFGKLLTTMKNIGKGVELKQGIKSVWPDVAFPSQEIMSEFVQRCVERIPKMKFEFGDSLLYDGLRIGVMEGQLGSMKITEEEIVRLAKACQRLMKVKKDVRSGMEFGVQLFEGYVPTFKAFVSDEVMLYSIRAAFGLHISLHNKGESGSFESPTEVSYLSGTTQREKEMSACKKAKVAFIINPYYNMAWAVYPMGTRVPKEIERFTTTKSGSGFNIHKYQIKQMYDQAKEVLGDESTGIEVSNAIL